MKNDASKLDFIKDCAENISKSPFLSTVSHDDSHLPMPSGKILAEIMEDIRSVVFPGYFGKIDVGSKSLVTHNEVIIERIYRQLTGQVERGLCFICKEKHTNDCGNCKTKSVYAVKHLLENLCAVQEMLSFDAVAAYEGDPAAQSVGEAIFCYPSIRAITNQRIAHILHVSGVPIIPRMITELAHSETGIDIHPGAAIGRSFFIDHGTGVVIGETTVIGNNVRLYQGVTLGAKSFPLDENGNPIKGIARHPIIEDDVTIYAGATILGRITIGRSSVIGANVWITENTPEGSVIVKRRDG